MKTKTSVLARCISHHMAPSFDSCLGFWGNHPYAKVHENGRSSSQIVVEQACEVSCCYLFLQLRNP